MVDSVQEDALSVIIDLGLTFLDLLVILPLNDLYPRDKGRLTRQNELHFVVRLRRRTPEDHSSRRIMHLVPVFSLETHNHTIDKGLPKFLLMDNASYGITTTTDKPSMANSSFK